MVEVIEYWLGIVGAMFGSLFSLEVVDGVSFGYVCVACAVLTIVINFVFRNLIGSVK